MFNEITHHVEETWNHVLHGNSTLVEKFECGGEAVVGLTALTLMGRSALKAYASRAEGLLPKLAITDSAPPAISHKVADKVLTELGSSRLPFNQTETAIELKYKLTVDDLARRVTVHLPPGFSPDKPTSVYYLLDGVQINNPAGNMLGINGWARTADARNIVAINLEQAEQSSLKVFGHRLPESIAGKSIPNVTSWSFEHGLLNKTAGVDDVKFFTTVYGQVQKSMNVKANNIVAFSDGGPLANAIAAEMPEGSLNGVANVAGTIMKDAPVPKPGIKGFFVNSKLDPTIPVDGGPGPQLTKWLPKIGQRHILDSEPGLQPIRYAEANGLSLTPKITETPVYIQKDYVTTTGDSEKVRAFLLKKGGHTWPGRDLGDGTNTALTNANGATVSRAEFSTNDRIVEFLEKGVPIKRTLE